jgi:hypothetical protein
MASSMTWYPMNRLLRSSPIAGRSRADVLLFSRLSSGGLVVRDRRPYFGLDQVPSEPPWSLSTVPGDLVASVPVLHK